MKRINTIKDQKIFNHIIKNGKFKKNNYYVLYSNINNESKKMFGIAISKKIGTAVIRNKLKRQTRAIIDNNQNLFKNNYNYIIMIRKSCRDAKFQDMEKALINLIEK